MSAKTYNVSEVAAALGSKNLAAMEVADRIQPVVLVGRLDQLVPSHVAPTAWYGGQSTPVAAEFGCIHVRSMDPGGIWILDLRGTPNGLATFRSRTQFGPPVPLGGSLVVSPPTAFGPAPASRVEFMRTAATQVLATNPAISTVTIAGGATGADPWTPVFVPPGTSFVCGALSANQGSGEWKILLRGVPATQGGD